MSIKICENSTTLRHDKIYYNLYGIFFTEFPEPLIYMFNSKTYIQSTVIQLYVSYCVSQKITLLCNTFLNMNPSSKV